MNELMMWLVGDSAWTEAIIGQKLKMNGRGDEDGSDDLPWFIEGSARYRKRSPFKCNGSCLNVRDIQVGPWWHNTPPPNLITDCPSQSDLVKGVNEERMTS